ncbi:MAG: 50S ribosomal protein L32 [Eubacteriaceae bacterium]|nr:50S ribosomal protein L32 [Eubacteriaceae bacterium]
MAVPKRKQSKSRKNMRKANFKLSMPGMSLCPNCGEIKQPHRVCPNCGSYDGRTVIAMEGEN